MSYTATASSMTGITVQACITDKAADLILAFKCSANTTTITVAATHTTVHRCWLSTHTVRTQYTSISVQKVQNCEFLNGYIPSLDALRALFSDLSASANGSHSGSGFCNCRVCKYCSSVVASPAVTTLSSCREHTQAQLLHILEANLLDVAVAINKTSAEARCAQSSGF
jgi:hypothetical protein